MLADVQQLGKDAGEFAAPPLWPLPDEAVLDLLRAAHLLEQTVATLRARLVHEADVRRLPATHGCRRTDRWLSSLLLIDPAPAREITGQAAALHQQPVVEQAVLDGRVDLGQAVAIADSVAAVPDRLADVDEVGLAETRRITHEARDAMIEMVGRLAPFQLRKIGQRILAHAAPEVAEQADAAALARQQARAHQRRGFTLSLPVDGMIRLSGALDVEAAAIVQAALHPLCQPLPEDDRSPAQRRADALVAYRRAA